MMNATQKKTLSPSRYTTDYSCARIYARKSSALKAADQLAGYEYISSVRVTPKEDGWYVSAHLLGVSDIYLV